MPYSKELSDWFKRGEIIGFPADLRTKKEIIEQIKSLKERINLNDVPILVPGIGGPMAIDNHKVKYWNAQVEALEWALGRPEGPYTWEPPRW